MTRRRHTAEQFIHKLREAEIELADLLHEARPLGCDQAAMPAQDRVGSDHRRDLHQQSSVDPLALRGEPAAQVIGQPWNPPTELFIQYAVLLN